MKAPVPGRTATSHDVEGRDTSRASEATLEQRELLAYGVTHVIVVTDEDPRACPACAEVADRMLLLASAPPLPMQGCCVGCTCRLSPLCLE